ncbi:MAG: bifunctional phosphoribosylaminoimidazolecarboxamide formyltransferase/IMP cyclohydrolase [Anaerocolumna aminovalerica]|jgi:phosphoribosylaminoimidazolecarboxamide formyltransferase/IMP cyclohydrolase|uniref:bifunctional phosphoribosylaminoimidazolecarboxamide formyltransferase/IMP cyclohydrolase n=1 Tax=Anaerocolumna aminovalerica TaxID=1527 RepID=UPI002907E86A|nr:bifunctional phosphoribosylaminoimidazolecarboxamide formyltransferase/IMP cyclohydrolase [Anaerocolumna aminovalerica]MDU6263442.1 bifunctional phosphoribosylaminoimidazolecarboxamide formyltransferase/IMP cyclohydrolase [Anaerocolumna aminovalerica]
MRALVSVSDKTGIVDFAKELVALGIEIISTGGTYNKLKEAGVPAIEISELTGFPECLEGRVKTLHPIVHAGLLAMKSKPEHMKQLADLKIQTIDMAVVNLYPFKATILKEGVTREEAIENIDIGGPTMLRSAAKNYQDVTVVVDPRDYEKVLRELKEKKEVSLDTKFYLMQKVFMHTSHYDTMIADYLKKQRNDYEMPETLTMTFEKVQDMRYGENPHQKAAFYREIGKKTGSITDAVQVNGKELSFNNINDTNCALELLKEFTEPTVVACKHGNPCGVGSGDTILDAWKKAFAADKVSIYGGIVVVNREVTLALAEEMKQVFLEVVAAPKFEKEALELLQTKKNVRLLELKDIGVPQDENAYDLKKVNGGLIVQTIDSKLLVEEELKVVTHRIPTDKEMEDLRFAWKVVKFVKSNGIALAKDKQTVGIGPGQVNRVWAAKQSIEHAEELIDPDATKGAVLASDAFFPFDDCVEAAHQAGITAIIQPGGSIRDDDSIKKCNEYGIAMVFTGMRHFKH